MKQSSGDISDPDTCAPEYGKAAIVQLRGVKAQFQLACSGMGVSLDILNFGIVRVTGNRVSDRELTV